MSKKNILIVEDEVKIALVLKNYLEREGYTIFIISQGDKVIPYIKKNTTELILLDIMLPVMDGIAICREIRKFSKVPIIMITAKVEEIDRIIGLELGADDYVCKPFSPREVVARVKAVLRRIDPQQPEDSIKIGAIRLNAEMRQVMVNNIEIKLTPIEFELLKQMLKHPGRVFSRAELIDHVQGYEFEGYERTVDSHIKNLRKKIEVVLTDKKIIMTVYGIGYKFCYE